MATGMGLHTVEQYKSLTVDLAEHQKRLFFCLYMMDRYVRRRVWDIIMLTIYSVVSLALGRPFAIQDDDITVEVCCFAVSSLNVLMWHSPLQM